MVRIWRRKGLGILCHMVVGCVVGAMFGFWIGRAFLLRTAETGLADYSRELIHHGDELSAEIDAAFWKMNAARFPFCSDQDIAALRAQTFHSRELKDIGRTRDGMLYCSAFLGRLASPFFRGASEAGVAAWSECIYRSQGDSPPRGEAVAPSWNPAMSIL